MISSRFIVSTTLFVSAALAPTIMHSYMPLPAAPEPRVQAMVVAPGGQPGQPTDRRTAWAVKRFASDDWMQRAYFGGAVTLTVVRSFDPKTLYHHPELAIAYPDDYAPARVTRLPDAPDAPVFVLQGQHTSRSLLSLYALSYERRYVDDPIAFQLRSSLALLVSRRKPMTLMYVREDGALPTASPDRSRAAQVLLAAMHSFDQQPPRD